MIRFLLPLALVGALAAQDWYVAPSGNDSAAGTLAAPFLTVQRAANAAYAGDTCWLRAGIYRETVTPPRSGTSAAPISFKPYPGEIATVSGLDVISGWTVHQGSIWKAAMPWTRNTASLKGGMDQVFVDGVMMPEARWPNLPTGVDPAAVSRGHFALSSAGTVPSAGNATYSATGLISGAWTGAKIYFLAGAHWFPMTGEITASNAGSVAFTYPARDGSVYQPRAKDHFYLFGVLAALDAPREWFRSATGTVYAWMPAGDSPSAHLVEAKRRTTAFDLRDRSNITIHGLRIVGAGIRTNSVSVGTRLQSIVGRYLTHAGWVPSWWNWSEPAGIQLAGADSLISDSDVRFFTAEGIRLTGARCRVENNWVRDAGGIYGGNISATGSDQIIERNTVSGTGSQRAIELTETSRAKVRYNDVSLCGRLTFDEGAIFVWRNWNGDGTEIAYNRIHDTHGLTNADGFDDYYGNAGIYIEGGTSNYLVHHNVIWKATDCAISMVAVSGPFTNVRVYNNSTDMPIGIQDPGRLCPVKNNVFSKYLYGSWTLTGDIGSNATTAVSYAGHQYRPSPGFVDAGNGDFQLAATSPLINQGVVISGITDGYLATNPDIGAYERGVAAWTAGSTLANQAPTVALASPSAGSTFTAPATVALAANAADSDGSVAKVEFFQGATKLGEDTIAPYAYTWSGVAAGSHALTAKATDNFGATTTSAAVTITVTATGFAAKIDFQPQQAPTVSGWLVDGGATYAVRNGLTYGWSQDVSATARDRNAAISPDQLQDTLVHSQYAGANASWEIAVPNGSYAVRVICGDALYTNSVFRMAVEGQVLVSGTPTAATRWIEGSGTITVGDGRLTLTNASGSSNNKVCLIEIVATVPGNG